MTHLTLSGGQLLRCVMAASLVLSLAGMAVAAKKAATPTRPDSRTVASEVDRLILESSSAGPAKRTADDDFLRRVTFDLAGTLPAPNEVTLFGLEPDPAKRTKTIDRLLASDEFARNW